MLLQFGLDPENSDKIVNVHSTLDDNKKFSTSDSVYKIDFEEEYTFSEQEEEDGTKVSLKSISKTSDQKAEEFLASLMIDIETLSESEIISKYNLEKVVQ